MSKTTEGTIFLFGFPETRAELEVLPRSPGWRLFRGTMFVAGGLILAPVVGLFPPHAPWVVAALAVGSFMGFRKWRERFTLLSLRGTCPKCGGGFSLRPGTPLRPVMTLPCPGCNHDSRLTSRFPSEPDPIGDRS